MDITVNVLDINDIKKLSTEYCEKLFPKRTKRAFGFSKEEDKFRSLGAGFLIHGVLNIKESNLYYNEHKKPYTDGIFFNISHSGDYVIAVSSDNEIGCDIEKIDSSRIKATEKLFLSEEKEWADIDPVNRFFALWTLKESVMKQQGSGISLSPKSFSVLPFLEGKPIDINKTKLYASAVKYNDYYISVCTATPIEKTVLETVTIQKNIYENGGV